MLMLYFKEMVKLYVLKSLKFIVIFGTLHKLMNLLHTFKFSHSYNNLDIMVTKELDQ